MATDTQREKLLGFLLGPRKTKIFIPKTYQSDTDQMLCLFWHHPSLRETAKMTKKPAQKAGFLLFWPCFASLAIAAIR